MNRFITFSALSSFAVSVESVVSTHSMLHTLTPLSPTLGADITSATLSLNFIGKDFIGQVGSLFYMYRRSGQIDKTPHRYLNKILVFQQLSITAECLTPYISQSLFLPVAGASNVIKNITFTGIGAINTKCINSLSESGPENENNNIGELYAKITAVNTCASSLGMIVGLSMIAFIPQHEIRLMILPVFSILRIVSMKYAVKPFSFYR